MLSYIIFGLVVLFVGADAQSALNLVITANVNGVDQFYQSFSTMLNTCNCNSTNCIMTTAYVNSNEIVKNTSVYYSPSMCSGPGVFTVDDLPSSSISDDIDCAGNLFPVTSQYSIGSSTLFETSFGNVKTSFAYSSSNKCYSGEYTTATSSPLWVCGEGAWGMYCNQNNTEIAMSIDSLKVVYYTDSSCTAVSVEYTTDYVTDCIAQQDDDYDYDDDNDDNGQGFLSSYTAFKVYSDSYGTDDGNSGTTNNYYNDDDGDNATSLVVTAMVCFLGGIATAIILLWFIYPKFAPSKLPSTVVSSSTDNAMLG